jgi:hypothetical protein
MFHLLLAAAVATATTGSLLTELQLAPQVDEPLIHTFEERFSAGNALERLQQIEAALESFRKMTEICEDRNLSDLLKEVGNTEWETQNLGFPNWAQSVEGALRKQALLIAHLEYELAQKRFAGREIDEKQLQAARKRWTEEKSRFKVFWDAFQIAD